MDEAVDSSVEPRLAQIFSPLLSVIEDVEAKKRLADLIRQYNREIVSERGMDAEAQVLEVIRDLAEGGSRLGMKEIANLFIDRHGEEFERKVTPKWVGYLVRRKLGLKPRKSDGVFCIPTEETSKLQRLYERYGLTPEEPQALAPARPADLFG